MDRNRDRDRETDPDKLEGLIRFESWVGWFRNRWPAQVSLGLGFQFSGLVRVFGWREGGKGLKGCSESSTTR